MKKLSGLNQERNMHRLSATYKQKQSKTVLNKHVSEFWFERTGCFFSTGRITDPQILALCGLLVEYCDVFISWLDSHSDGTHSLQRIHWWAIDAMLNFSKSFLMKKQTQLHFWWAEGKYIFINFHFWANNSFKFWPVFPHKTIIWLEKSWYIMHKSYEQ